MDERTRVLVVEDIATARESYVANLELSEAYRVDSAADLQGAYEATDARAYHVAVVDIMLAGERDVANRDGVKIVKRLQRLAEGTKAVVLSAQKAETQLVGDLVLEYGAFKYLDKEVLERDGIRGLLGVVESAAKASSVGKPTWESVVGSLMPGQPEQRFVSDVMTRLDFGGGFENLKSMLVHNARHLVPLLAGTDGAHMLQFDEDAGGFSGAYWSKGQGQAVEIFIGGKESAARRRDGTGPGAAELLLEREKAGLRLVVSARPDLPRGGFASRLIQGESAE
jgi:CheY-like chemotaxis protein